MGRVCGGGEAAERCAEEFELCGEAFRVSLGASRLLPRAVAEVVKIIER